MIMDRFTRCSLCGMGHLVQRNVGHDRPIMVMSCSHCRHTHVPEFQTAGREDASATVSPALSPHSGANVSRAPVPASAGG